MERLILDTTVLVAAERGGVDAVVGDDDDVAIAALTIAELRVGVLLATGKRKAVRSAYVDGIERTFRIEDYTTTIAGAHAELLAETRRSGTPRGAHDLIIAATAIATDRRLVTADVRGFTGLPGLALATRRTS